MKKMTIIKIAIIAIFLSIMTYVVYQMGAFDRLPEPEPVMLKK